MKLSHIVKNNKAKMYAIAQDSATDLASRVTIGTPVDTGNARQNWRTSGSVKTTFKHMNNTPYITALEYGHSEQAPSGMVRINVAQWHQIVASHVKSG